jgi:cellulose synthase/poly-beta-1,6-N-acetylglucosamine synthase-like glycosyltransferase
VLALILVMLAYVIAGRRSRAAGPVGVARAPLSSDPKVVVAITAYNDAEATAQAARDFKAQPNVLKVFVVDNNSTDDTQVLARQAGAEVVTETRQGYGYACIRGLSEAVKVPGADVVVLTEGDGTFLADDLAKFMAYIGDADLVVGNRVVRGLVDADSQMDHFFTWGNMAVAMLLRLRFWDGRHLGPAGLTDVGCTYRAIRRSALERILPDLVVGGNNFSPHMLMVAMARDLVVIEIPVRLRQRVGRSKGASQSLLKGLQVGLAMIWDILTFNLPDRPQPARAELEPAQVPEKAGAAR